MKDTAPSIINLGRAEIQLPLDTATRRLAARAFCDHGYAPPLGIEEARQSVAHWLSDLSGLETAASEILLTAGGTLAWSIALLGLTRTGDQVLVPEPGYANLERAVRSLGREPVPYAVDPVSGRLKIEALPVFGDARALVFMSPHNPAGAVASDERLRALETYCADRGMALVCDASFIPYAWSPGPVPRLQAFGRNVELGSLGKALGIADLRLGWIRAEPAIVFKLSKLQSSVSMPPSRAAQCFVAGCLVPDGRMSQMRHEARLRLEAAMDGAARGGVALRWPEGGLTFWIDLQPSGRSQKEVVQAALNDLGLLVRAGADYGCREGPWIRAGVASDPAITGHAYEMLAELLRPNANVHARLQSQRII